MTPGQVAPYFSKIQCFCFEEQRLNAGETVDMPVLFYLDPTIVENPAMNGIETITLNYTFFSQSFLSLFKAVALTILQKRNTIKTANLPQHLLSSIHRINLDGGGGYA